MNKHQLFIKAHALARELMKEGCGCYAIAFKIALKRAYLEAKVIIKNKRVVLKYAFITYMAIIGLSIFAYSLEPLSILIVASILGSIAIGFKYYFNVAVVCDLDTVDRLEMAKRIKKDCLKHGINF